MSQTSSDPADGWDAFGESPENSTSTPPLVTDHNNVTRQEELSSEATIASSTSAAIGQDQAEDDDWFGEFATVLPTPIPQPLASSENTPARIEQQSEPLTANDDWDDFNSVTPTESEVPTASLPVDKVELPMQASSETAGDDDGWAFNSTGTDEILPSSDVSALSSDSITNTQEQLQTSVENSEPQLSLDPTQTEVQSSSSISDSSDSSHHESVQQPSSSTSEVETALSASIENDFGDFASQFSETLELSNSGHATGDNEDENGSVLQSSSLSHLPIEKSSSASSQLLGDLASTEQTANSELPLSSQLPPSYSIGAQADEPERFSISDQKQAEDHALVNELHQILDQDEASSFLSNEKMRSENENMLQSNSKANNQASSADSATEVNNISDHEDYSFAPVVFNESTETKASTQPSVLTDERNDALDLTQKPDEVSAETSNSSGTSDSLQTQNTAVENTIDNALNVYLLTSASETTNEDTSGTLERLKDSIAEVEDGSGQLRSDPFTSYELPSDNITSVPDITEADKANTLATSEQTQSLLESEEHFIKSEAVASAPTSSLGPTETLEESLNSTHVETHTDSISDSSLTLSQLNAEEASSHLPASSSEEIYSALSQDAPESREHAATAITEDSSRSAESEALLQPPTSPLPTTDALSTQSATLSPEVLSSQPQASDTLPVEHELTNNATNTSESANDPIHYTDRKDSHITITEAREQIPLQSEDESAKKASDSQEPEARTFGLNDAVGDELISSVAAAVVESALPESESQQPETSFAQPPSNSLPTTENAEATSAEATSAEVDDEWGGFAESRSRDVIDENPFKPEKLVEAQISDSVPVLNPSISEQRQTAAEWNFGDDEAEQLRSNDAATIANETSTSNVPQTNTQSETTDSSVQEPVDDTTPSSTPTSSSSSSSSASDSLTTDNSTHSTDTVQTILPADNDIEPLSSSSSSASLQSLSPSSQSNQQLQHKQQEVEPLNQEVLDISSLSSPRDSSVTSSTEEKVVDTTNFDDDDWGGFAEASESAETPRLPSASLSTRTAAATITAPESTTALSYDMQRTTTITTPPTTTITVSASGNDDDEWGEFGKPEEDEPSVAAGTNSTVASASVPTLAPAEDDEWGEFGTAPISSTPVSSSSTSSSNNITSSSNTSSTTALPDSNNDDDESEWGGFGTAEKASEPASAPTPAPVAISEPSSYIPERKIAGITMTILLTLPADQFGKKMEECVAELFGPEPTHVPSVPTVESPAKLQCSKCQEPRSAASNVCLYCGQRFGQVTMPQFKGSWLERALFENLGLPPPLTQEVVEDQIESTEEEPAKIIPSTTSSTVTTITNISRPLPVTPSKSTGIKPPSTPTSSAKTAASLPTMSMTLDSFLSGDDESVQHSSLNKSSVTGAQASTTATQSVESILASLPNYRFMLFTEVQMSTNL